MEHLTKQTFSEKVFNYEKNKEWQFEGNLPCLIDFYADWCEPCKKMAPYLEEISRDMEDKVIVIRINADDNKNLMKELKIDALPELRLYKSKTMYWRNIGFIEKADVVKQIK